jgi:hypothetical protein
MNRNIVPSGRILGIPIGLDYSWFLIIALPIWMLTANYCLQNLGTGQWRNNQSHMISSPQVFLPEWSYQHV